MSIVLVGVAVVDRQQQRPINPHCLFLVCEDVCMYVLCVIVYLDRNVFSGGIREGTEGKERRTNIININFVVEITNSNK